MSLLGFYYKWKFERQQKTRSVKLLKRYNKLMKKFPKIAYEFEKTKHELDVLQIHLINGSESVTNDRRTD